MTGPTRVLLKTTIPSVEDDWHIGRFSMLAEHLAAIEEDGTPLYNVTSRDRFEDPEGNDADLAALAGGEWDQLWLFAVDDVGALSSADCAAIEAFRARGGGLLITRDHMNLGSCLTKLGALGLTQHFQLVNPEPDPERHAIDDSFTTHITWPNYHSGANGDFQPVEADDHPLMRRADGSRLSTLPAHPHEGAVGVPDALSGCATVIARGRSKITGKTFNLAVAVEEQGKGRAVADSSFHHLCDYNWDPRMGAPSFVDEPPGSAILEDARAAADARDYAANIAHWLAGRR